jgi:hypothetical protein
MTNQERAGIPSALEALADAVIDLGASLTALEKKHKELEEKIAWLEHRILGPVPTS